MSGGIIVTCCDEVVMKRSNQANFLNWVKRITLPSVAALFWATSLKAFAVENQSLKVAQAPTFKGLLAQQLPSQHSPDLKALLTGKVPFGTVTSRTPSAVRSSIPSLWWISEQLASLEQYGNKFIQDWIAYPPQGGQPGKVDLLVNRQQWSLLDYLQRYEFVRKFSTIARGYGYNTRVYDSPDRTPVALYTCDFRSLTCNLNISGSSSLRRR